MRRSLRPVPCGDRPRRSRRRIGIRAAARREVVNLCASNPRQRTLLTKPCFILEEDLYLSIGILLTKLRDPLGKLLKSSSAAGWADDAQAAARQTNSRCRNRRETAAKRRNLPNSSARMRCTSLPRNVQTESSDVGPASKRRLQAGLFCSGKGWFTPPSWSVRESRQPFPIVATNPVLSPPRR